MRDAHIRIDERQAKNGSLWSSEPLRTASRYAKSQLWYPRLVNGSFARFGRKRRFTRGGLGLDAFASGDS